MKRATEMLLPGWRLLREDERVLEGDKIFSPFAFAGKGAWRAPDAREVGMKVEIFYAASREMSTEG